MKIKTVCVEQAQTFNLGDFNSVKLGISLFAELDEGEDLESARAASQAQCKAAIREAAQPFVQYIRLAPRVEERVAGMTVIN